MGGAPWVVIGIWVHCGEREMNRTSLRQQASQTDSLAPLGSQPGHLCQLRQTRRYGSFNVLVTSGHSFPVQQNIHSLSVSVGKNKQTSKQRKNKHSKHTKKQLASKIKVFQRETVGVAVAWMRFHFALSPAPRLNQAPLTARVIH